MLYLLVTPSCSGCVKAKKFFNKKKIHFEEINFFKQPIPPKLLLDILQMTKNGVYDIISTRSKYLVKNKIDIDQLSIKELINLINNVPSILKRPIIIQYSNSVQPQRLIVGYNEDGIQVFSRELKIQSLPDNVYNVVKVPQSMLTNDRSQLQDYRARVSEFISTLNLSEIDDATLVALLYQQLPKSNAIKKLYYDYLLNKDPITSFFNNSDYDDVKDEEDENEEEILANSAYVNLNTGSKIKNK